MKRKITIIGTGHVGLVTGACFAEMGHKVVCVDRDKEKIKNLKKGIIPIYEPHLKELVSKNIKKKRLNFTSSIKEGIKESKIIFICVGTPARIDGNADLSSIEAVTREIAQLSTSDKIIVEKSTVPVKTEEYVKKTLDLYKKNKKIKFFVVSNPEFLREGSSIKDFLEPDRIVIGVEDEKAKEIMLDIYSSIKAPKIVTDLKSAELIKHVSNTFLALKISFINLIAQICEKTGADIKEVALGMGLDKRIGKSFLEAGIGYGGSCLPKDIKAFIRILKDLGIEAALLESIEDINKKQREFFFQKIKDSLWNVSGKTIGILGLAFKPNTDDIREAPSITIINKLLKEGAKIKAYDPVAIDRAKKVFGKKIKFAKNLYEVARNADALVILTEWDEFKNMDLRKIKKLLKLPKIIDGRNIFDPKKMAQLGFNYSCLGRKQYNENI